MKFKVGEKVQLIKARDHLQRGTRGVIVNIKKCKNYEIGVDWGKGNMGGHDCGGTCKDGQGWYVLKKEVKIISNNSSSSMIKRYKLLKDSYDLKAGAIVKYDEDEDDYHPRGCNNLTGQIREGLKLGMQKMYGEGFESQLRALKVTRDTLDELIRKAE